MRKSPRDALPGGGFVEEAWRRMSWRGRACGVRAGSAGSGAGLRIIARRPVRCRAGSARHPTVLRRPFLRRAAEPLVAAVAQEAHRDPHDAVGDPDDALVEPRPRAPSPGARPPARRRRSCARAPAAAGPAKSGSRTTTLASRAISRLYGSMFDEPTVAQSIVDDRDLGVQERPVVLADRDAGREQLAVQRAAGVVQQHVLDARLQQQRHARRRGPPRRSARGGSACRERSTSWR